MPWIEQIDENDARGDLKQIYEEIKRERGKISNVMRVHSLLPSTMDAHLYLYTLLMFKLQTGLSRQERELVAVVVSLENKCEYCVNHHSEALKALWKDEQKIKDVIKQNWAKLPERERTLALHAIRLTRFPNSLYPAEVESLRRVGLSDQDILHLTLLIAYFNFVNRIILGLGVESSEDEVRGYKY